MTDAKHNTGLTAANIKARQGRITASAFPIIMRGGAAGYNELMRIAHERLGLPYPRKEINAAMRHGHETEGAAATIICGYWNSVRSNAKMGKPYNHPPGNYREWKFNHNLDFYSADVKVSGWADKALIGCTPDLLLTLPDGRRGNVQIKTPYSTARFAEYAETPNPDHVTQVWFEDYVLKHCGIDIDDDHRLLAYTRAMPTEPKHIAAHCLFAYHLTNRRKDARGIPKDKEREWLHNEIADRIATVERRIWEVMQDLKAKSPVPGNNAVEKISFAKHAVDEIDAARKQLKRKIDEAAKQAAGKFAQTLATELDVMEEYAKTGIKPPGTRINEPAPVFKIIDQASIPPEYFKRVIDEPKLRAAVEAGKAIAGLEITMRPRTLTVIKKTTTAAAAEGRDALRKALGLELAEALPPPQEKLE